MFLLEKQSSYHWFGCLQFHSTHHLKWQIIFILLFFINYLLWLKIWKLYPENNASPFIARRSLHSVNRETTATLSSPEVFLVLLTLISSTCVLVWALSTSFVVPEKAKSLPPWRVILCLSVGSWAQAPPQGRTNVLHVKSVPSWPPSYLSISFPIRIAGCVICVWTRHYQGKGGEAAVDQG